MASGSVGHRWGLPASALAVMIGIVFVVNVHRYGPLGVGGGLLLCVLGVVLGAVFFRPQQN